MDAITACVNLIQLTCNLQARLQACGDVVKRWRCSISTGCGADTPFLVQFQRPPISPSPSGFNFELDYTLDAKELARTLCDTMKRDGSSWEGNLRDMPSVTIVIHQAEPQHPKPGLVQL
jgi:hypothetical protein